MTTNITEEHRRAFAALASGEHDNFALFSCFCGGSPAAAIVAANPRPPAEEGGEPEYELRPLFVYGEKTTTKSREPKPLKLQTFSAP